MTNKQSSGLIVPSPPSTPKERIVRVVIELNLASLDRLATDHNISSRLAHVAREMRNVFHSSEVEAIDIANDLEQLALAMAQAQIAADMIRHSSVGQAIATVEVGGLQIGRVGVERVL